MKTKTFTTDEFIQFMVEQTPKFDEHIMRSIRLKDSWRLPVRNFRWLELPAVIPMGGHFTCTSAEEAQDRFRNIWPDTTLKWKAVKPRRRP